MYCQAQYSGMYCKSGCLYYLSYTAYADLEIPVDSAVALRT